MPNPPAPLKLDAAALGGEVEGGNPGSAAARLNLQEFQQKRAKALSITPHQLKKLPEKERDEDVFQYLTPDEIWLFKDSLTKVLPQVEKIRVDGEAHKKGFARQSTLEGFIDHEAKRREYLSLSDAELLAKSPEEIEAYYQFLTPDEILEQNEKLQNLKQMQSLSLT